MASKRTASTDINHDNWDQEEEPEVSGTFQVAPAAVLARRQIKYAARRLDRPKSSSSSRPSVPVFDNNVAESEMSCKSDSTENVFQSLGGTFLSRPAQVTNLSQQQPPLPLTITKPRPMSNTTMFSTSNTFQNRPALNDKDELGPTACRTVSSSKSLSTYADGFPAFDKTTSIVDLSSAGFKPAVADSNNFFRPPKRATPNIIFPSVDLPSDGIRPGVPNNTIKQSPAIVEALVKMDSRHLLKSVPEDILERLRAKALATSKSLNFLKRTYQLNTTAVDWLSLLIQKDLTVNLSNVIPSYVQELLKLVEEEIASQESETVKATLIPHKIQLQQMLIIFRESGMLNEDESPTEQKSENLSKSTANNVQKSSNSMVNKLESPPQSTRMKINDDASLQGMNTNTAKQQNTVLSKERPGMAFFMRMPSASPLASEELSKTKDNTEQGEEEENDDEASKANPFTPVVETDSVCSMRCKVFVKKDASDTSDTPYQNRGVGMLFVKPITTGKVQVVVRADNSLGNIILNVCVTSDIPVEIANKNTLMLVCCPMQGETPRTVLIRVKNKDEVDLLHKNLML